MSVQRNSRYRFSSRNIVAVLLLVLCFTGTNAQPVDKLTDIPLDMAVKQLGPVVGQQIPDHVKIFGIGNISSLAKESGGFNAALAAYLVSYKKFRHIILYQDNWQLRSLNDYLTGDMTFDSTLADLLFMNSLSNTPWCTAEFRSFIHWLKKFNLSHPGEKVRLSGMLLDELIPPAYFLAAYIFPLDREQGLRLSQKWGVAIYNDSLAYHDIETWYRQIRKNTVLFHKNQKLLLRCEDDLEHNTAISQSSRLGHGSEAFLAAMIQANVRWILKKSGQRTIFYASNSQVAKSDVVVLGFKLQSFGIQIHRRIGKEYYASLTDFADSATLHLLDPQTGQTKQTLIAGTTQAQTMARQKNAFFLPQDRAGIKKYVPRSVHILIGHENLIVPEPGTAAADALFIFRQLTPAPLLKRL